MSAAFALTRAAYPGNAVPLRRTPATPAVAVLLSRRITFLTKGKNT